MITVFVEFNDIEDKVKIGDKEITIREFFEDLETTENTICCSYYDDDVKNDILNLIDEKINSKFYDMEGKNIFKQLKKDVKKSDAVKGPFFAVLDFYGKCFETIYGLFVEENKMKERIHFNWNN